MTHKKLMIASAVVFAIAMALSIFCFLMGKVPVAFINLALAAANVVIFLVNWNQSRKG